MLTEPIDAYLAGFAARCAAVRRPGQRLVDDPGIYGLPASGAGTFTCVLVTDDRPMICSQRSSRRRSRG